MIATLRARTNHYETLGLKPTASDDEIAEAFARQIRAPRPSAFGGLIEVSVAYEVLRDPAKRRAHDASLGLKPEPEPRPSHYSATARFAETPFAAVVRARPVHDRLPGATIPATSEPAAEAAQAPPIATSPPRDRRSPPIAHARPPRRTEEFRLGDAEDRPVEWKRPAILIGAPVAAVVLLGAVAGWRAGKGEEQSQAVTTALPPPKSRTAKVAPPPSPAQPLVEAQSDWQPRAAAPAKVRRKAAPPTPGPSEDPLAARPEPSQVAEAASEPPPVAESPAVETAAAMPLPNAVIARTIERIGYACGRVASTSAVEGALGVYTVNCTSGASYQAKPVRGRYHFRRVGSR